MPFKGRGNKKNRFMKLLFCDNAIWGLVNFREAVFRHFYERGAEIVLVAPSDEHAELKAKVPAYVRYIPVRLSRTSRNPLNDVAYLWQLLRIYRKERPDCIFHYTIKPNVYGTLAARLLGIHRVAMVAGLGYTFAKKGLPDRVAQNLLRLGLRLSDRVFVLNTSNRDVLVSRGFVRQGDVILLRGGEGIDTEQLCEGEEQKENTPTTFLMVGRALYDKGYAEFVEASRLLKAEGAEAKFCLLGSIDEAYPNAVPRTTIDADVKAGVIQYLGFTNQPESIMGQPGVVVVVPSYHEGMNRSLMEACALGKPIITTNIPGCREMVKEGRNGYLIPAKNGQALAEAMRRYLSLPYAEKVAMGHRCRRIALQTYDVHHVIKQYEECLASVLHTSC